MTIIHIDASTRKEEIYAKITETSTQLRIFLF